MTPRHKGGRPPVIEGERLETVAAGVDQLTYMKIKAVAARRGVPLAAVVRSVLTTAFAYRRDASGGSQ